MAQGPRVQSQWERLTPAHSAKLRRLYAHAVDRFEAKHHAHGLTGKAAEPRYATWGQFKAAMECGGNFGAFSGLAQAACIVTTPINWMVEKTKALVLKCDGIAVGGAAGTAAACAGTAIYEKLMPF